MTVGSVEGVLASWSQLTCLSQTICFVFRCSIVKLDIARVDVCSPPLFLKADMILLVGTNPRWESPVFNARIRKTFVDGAQVGGWG